MRGIIDGRRFNQRVRNVRSNWLTGTATPRHDKPLNAFLTRAVQAVREVYGGPVSYASLPFEHVDWDMFDLIGVDHYWHERIKDRYLARLEPLLASGKPVVITEFGFLTRTGAEQAGPIGAENFQPLSMLLHMTPVTRRFVRPRVKTVHERNEDLQARCLTSQLRLRTPPESTARSSTPSPLPYGSMRATRSTTSTPTASASSSPLLAAGTAPPTRTWPGNRRSRSRPSRTTTRPASAPRPEDAA